LEGAANGFEDLFVIVVYPVAPWMDKPYYSFEASVGKLKWSERT
jgi:hypothetical protein